MLNRHITIATLLIACLAGLAQAASVLYFEDFEDGSYSDSMNRWNASTSWTASVKTGGVPSSGKYLYTDDRLNYGLYFSSKQGFEYVGKHIEYSAHMQAGSAGFPDQRYAHLYIANAVGRTKSRMVYLRIYGSNHGSSPSGATPRPNQVYCRLLYEDGSGDHQWEESFTGYTVANGNAWNHGRIVVRPDRIVEFYVNDDLVYTSTQQLTDDYDGVAPIMVGGRKSNYDNVMVQEFDVQPEIPEPATMLAGIAGLAGVGRYLRRQKRF